MINKKLPESFSDHELAKSKRFVDCRECHILGDLVLVYRLENNHCKLLLLEIGNHNNILEKLIV